MGLLHVIGALGSILGVQSVRLKSLGPRFSIGRHPADIYRGGSGTFRGNLRREEKRRR